MASIRVQRVYDPPDGDFRVLVDRLWPRGMTRERAAIDLWATVLTPSNDLRRWLHADPAAHTAGFADRFRAELDAADTASVLDILRAQEVIVLVTAVRDPAHSHIPVLLGWLASRGLPSPDAAPDGSVAP